MTEPLQPPAGVAAAEPVLRLEAPPAPAPVAATSAPTMAPAVDPAVMPALDAKVDQFVHALSSAQTKSPDFAAKAADVRTMGDADIRSAVAYIVSKSE